MNAHLSHGSTGAYQAGSPSLAGAMAMGTGVMIGAGILALTGQVAQLAGPLFPLAFVVAAIASGFSAYSYIKLASAYPSAGGIGMFLMKACGRGAFPATRTRITAVQSRPTAVTMCDGQGWPTSLKVSMTWLHLSS